MVSLSYLRHTIPISILCQSVLVPKHGTIPLDNKEQVKPQGQQKESTQRCLVNENIEVPVLLLGFWTDLV